MGGSIDSSSSSSGGSGYYSYDITNDYYGTSRNASAISGNDNQGGDVVFKYLRTRNHTSNSQQPKRSVLVASAAKVDYNRDNSSVWSAIGLSGEASNLQKNLQSIAASTNTSTLAGLNTILRETTRALLFGADYWKYGFSYVDQKFVDADAENRFQELSIRERTKVDFESVVNVNNAKYQVPVVPAEFEDLGQKFIVVTILLALQGSLKLPVIEDNQSMKEALEYMRSIEIREREDLKLPRKTASTPEQICIGKWECIYIHNVLVSGNVHAYISVNLGGSISLGTGILQAAKM
nr:uncharacterized protein LOC113735363 [Coffea arabica]XP_027120846.1 uncharacterized protein LOC113737905 [Coffea arabica]